jgi:signal transduction histidine kinase
VRIESRSLDLNLERFDLLGLMTTLISDYSNQADRNNISMKLENDGKDIDLDIQFEKQEIVNLFVYADKNRIIQVLSNILINALKFTKKGVLL